MNITMIESFKCRGPSYFFLELEALLSKKKKVPSVVHNIADSR